MMRKFAFAFAFALLVPTGAFAASHSFSTLGPHLGFSSDPGQVLFGGQLEFGEVAPQLDFVPGVDLGFGDHFTVVSLNGDFHYRIPLEGTKWQPYAGAGIALHFISTDVIGPGIDRSTTDGGGSLILGADVPTAAGNRFFAEAKFGLGDGPSFKMIAGWNFKLK